MENKNLTAVEWLVEQLIPKAFATYDATTCNAIGQAKQMFEEQIEDAYKAKTGSNPRHPTIQEFFDKQADQYYNITYGKE